jgi:hypothetical protein
LTDCFPVLGLLAKCLMLVVALDKLYRNVVV